MTDPTLTDLARERYETGAYGSARLEVHPTGWATLRERMTNQPTARYISPLDELRELVLAKLVAVADDYPPATWPASAPALADEIMSLFHVAEQDWEILDITTLGDGKERWIKQRWLVARVPSRAETWERERQPPAVRVD